jgi:hypothetical protein
LQRPSSELGSDSPASITVTSTFVAAGTSIVTRMR